MGYLGILMGVVVLAVIAWLGLRVKPRPFDPFAGQGPELETVELPEGLPAPVARFFRALYGDQIPVIASAVISGRAALRLFGVTLPGRFRFIHRAGQDYRHYIETTFFGRPVLKVNETYLDGKARLALPFGVVEEEPKVDQAANLGLWAESSWLPAIYLTDPRVRWEAIDEETALLIVPFGELQERMVARFDPQSGMLRLLEAMRYREAADEAKILWISEARDWREISGMPTLAVGAVTWFDQGRPWAIFAVDEMVYNVDVREIIRRRGL